MKLSNKINKFLAQRGINPEEFWTEDKVHLNKVAIQKAETYLAEQNLVCIRRTKAGTIKFVHPKYVRLLPRYYFEKGKVPNRWVKQVVMESANAETI